MKPFAESCEQNKDPILKILNITFASVKTVLEIGSGTGQHAVFFSGQMPHLHWYTSDVADYHEGIRAWLQDAPHENISDPFVLNVNQPIWTDRTYDAVFSANTTHIMGWSSVQQMFAGIGRVLNDSGVFCLYGPFNYNGHYTSNSNKTFDAWLKARDPNSGIRDFDALNTLAERANMTLVRDDEMPTNNRILTWKKHV